MTGEIIIRPGAALGDLPEDAVAAGYQISGSAQLSDFERIVVVYQLGVALSFDEKAWGLLAAMAAHEPPFDNLVELSWPIAPGGEEAPDPEDIPEPREAPKYTGNGAAFKNQTRQRLLDRRHDGLRIGTVLEQAGLRLTLSQIMDIIEAKPTSLQTYRALSTILDELGEK